MIYEETVGTSPEDLFGVGSFNTIPSWRFSWDLAWGRSWGFVRSRPPYSSSTNSPDTIYEDNSVSGDVLYSSTSGSNPNDIYEEN